MPALEEVMARDAHLHDLSFVDNKNGWAVGDRGVILRTTDGGRRWRRLASPVECPLYAVHFINGRSGWAVGGFTKPYTHSTHAVVLSTRNGGDTWRRLPTETLPLLRTVKFFDDRHGVAAGAGTSFAPGGVFETKDGGRTWRPLPADRPSHWFASDFLEPGVGVMAGARGELATIGRREVTRSEAVAGDRRGLHALKLIGPTGGWLVGDGGLVLATTDLGRTWQPPAGALPAATRDACDWRALAIDGPRVWIAGAPGSVVLHSPDAGRSWQPQPTGVTTPLSAITFTDAQNGWAAGALGTILATSDGGRTWRVQRRGGERMSVAVLTADLAAAPLDLLASMAAAEGYLTTVAAPFAPEAPTGRGDEAARLTESVVASGASLAHAGWRLSIRPDQQRLSAEALFANFNRQTDGRATQEMQQQLVAMLRSLRPDLVVIAASHAEQPTGAETLLESFARDAIDAAGDATQMIELANLGLAPHQARRMVVAAPSQPRSSPRIPTGDFNALLGTSPALWVGSARGLVSNEYNAPPAAITWRVVMDSGTQSASGRNPMAGIAVARGSGARRPAASPPPGELAALRAVARKRGTCNVC